MAFAFTVSSKPFKALFFLLLKAKRSVLCTGDVCQTNPLPEKSSKGNRSPSSLAHRPAPRGLSSIAPMSGNNTARMGGEPGLPGRSQEMGRRWDPRPAPGEGTGRLGLGKSCARWHFWSAGGIKGQPCRGGLV